MGKLSLDKVYQALEKGDLQTADNLAVLMYKNNINQVNALELMVSIAIEIGDMQAAEERMHLLKQFPITSYRLFLQARIYFMGKRHGAAIDTLLQSLEEPHKYTATLAVLEKIYNLIGKCCRFLGYMEDSAGCYLLAAEYADGKVLKLLEYSNYLFNLHYLDKSAEYMLRAAKGYQKILGDVPQFQHVKSARHEKIRIGYLSSDLRRHVVAEFVQAFFSSYDKSSFEVYAYANCVEDEISRELGANVDCWKNVHGINPEGIANIIYDDEIDILVELGGHTANNNLPVLAYRPAPVQICGIGYFGSTGMEAVDYFLGDEYLDINDNAPDFVEKIIRLEHSHWCYRPLKTSDKDKAISGMKCYGDPCATPPAPFQKNGFVTFGSFNAFQKINSNVLSAWKKILDEVPNSKLYLKGSAYVNDEQMIRFSDMLDEVSISMDRIIFEDRSDDYLADYGKMDIALDTFPYAGGGTTCDALYMGVPVITLYGDTHHSRFGYSALMNVGLNECCADSVNEYIKKAVDLANNKKRLKYLHKVIRRRMEMTSLMDTDKYMTELEGKYNEIWYRYINDTDLEYTNIYAGKKAWRYIQAKDYYRAIWYIDKVIAYNGDNVVELYEMQAAARQSVLDSGMALRCIRKAYERLQGEFNKGTADFQSCLLNNYGHYARSLGYIDESLSCYKAAIDLSDTLEKKISTYGNYLYAIVCSMADWHTVMEEHNKYNHIFHELRSSQQLTKLCNTYHGGKIRLAYMSPDFRHHVMFSFYYTMLYYYDRSKFHVTCYQLSKQTDGYTEHLKTLVDEWINISKFSLEEKAIKIKEDKQDIIVDLAGHSANSGLGVFAYRVALVQISGLGWMETTGLQETDYFITDEYVDPPNDNYLMEKSLYLTSQFCYTARNDVPIPREAPCIKNGYITFGVFNNWYKVNEFTLKLWKRIMDNVPESVLLIKGKIMSSLSAQEEIFERMYALGFDMDRVSFEAATDTYMNRYLSVDIALDTFPYPGGGTTCDALYMGVPVITLYSKRRGSRFGYSILRNIGLDNLATDDPDTYIKMAISLANDWETLNYLHGSIRDMMKSSPVMNGRQYIKEIEKQYFYSIMEKLQHYD